MSKKSKDIFSEIPNPKFIQYSDTVLVGDYKIQEMTPENFISFAKSKGNSIVSWTESVNCPADEKIRQKLKATDAVKLNEKIFKIIIDTMQSLQTQLVICNMGEECGFGLATRQLIPKGTVLGPLAGVIKTLSVEDIKNRLEASNNYLAPVFEDEQQMIVCDHEKQSNFFRFLQHAFDEEDMKNYKTLSKINSDYTTANVGFDVFSYDDEVFLAVRALRTIEANEIITVNYGYEYWVHINKRPQIFDPFGRCIKSQVDQYLVNILGEREIFKMGRSLTLKPPSTHISVSQEDVMADKHFYYENDSREFYIPSGPLLEKLNAQGKNTLILEVTIPDYKASSVLGKCILLVLKKITGFNWEYKIKSGNAFTLYDKDIFHYLKEMYDFKITSATVKKEANIFPGKKIMILDLSQEADQDKLAGTPCMEKQTFVPNLESKSEQPFQL